MKLEVDAVRWMVTIHKTISASSHFRSRQSTEVLACVEFSCYSSDAARIERRSFSHFSKTNIPVECTSLSKRTTQTAIRIYWKSVELFVVCVYCFKLTLFMHMHKFRRKASLFHLQKDPSSHVEIVIYRNTLIVFGWWIRHLNIRWTQTVNGRHTMQHEDSRNGHRRFAKPYRTTQSRNHLKRKFESAILNALRTV